MSDMNENVYFNTCINNNSLNKKPIKVLHIVSNIAIGNGIMSVLMCYLRNMDRTKVQFDFMFYDIRKNTYAEEIKKLGGEIIETPNIRHPIKFRCFFNLFCEENRGQYCIAHIHDSFMSFFVQDIKKVLGVKKLIIHSHNPKLSDHLLGEIRNRILSYPSYYIADYYFACSKESGFYAFGTRFNRGFILNNAIEVKGYRYNKTERIRIRNELNIKDKFVIGNIAGFRKQKNHSFLIDVFCNLLTKEENAVLVLVGVGPTIEKIKSKARAKGVYDKILFLGIRNDVNILLSSFDVFVLPSFYEGLGIVLVEAQAEGLPCVYSNSIPATTEFVNNT